MTASKGTGRRVQVFKFRGEKIVGRDDREGGRGGLQERESVIGGGTGRVKRGTHSKDNHDRGGAGIGWGWFYMDGRRAYQERPVRAGS